jgi:hypothetical protein
MDEWGDIRDLLEHIDGVFQLRFLGIPMDVPISLQSFQEENLYRFGPVVVGIRPAHRWALKPLSARRPERRCRGPPARPWSGARVGEWVLSWTC